MCAIGLLSGSALVGIALRTYERLPDYNLSAITAVLAIYVFIAAVLFGWCAFNVWRGEETDRDDREEGYDNFT